MVALDTARDRIAVQAGLPGAIYNAYTGALDLGWSRHENFGTQACASCLYLPTGPAPSRTAEVADAIGEPEPRVALYYVTGVPVDKPLPAQAVGSLPSTQPTWANRSLLEDIAARHDLADEQVRAHEGAHIDQFYGEAVCGGTLLPVPRGRAAVLPLPQASAAAGIMLAVQTVAACSPELRQHLTHQPNGTLDLLGGATPYSSPLAPTPGCICQDPDYRAVYDARWVATPDDGAPITDGPDDEPLEANAETDARLLNEGRVGLGVPRSAATAPPCRPAHNTGANRGA